MKNQELFDRTVGILVTAYVNNNLHAFNCAACAVGNLVAGNMGYKTLPDEFGYKDLNGQKVDAYWQECITGIDRIETDLSYYRGIVKKQIDCTGYSVLEVANIEFVFMKAFHGVSGKDETAIFNGLMNVVDYLMQIHEATTEEITQAKSLFKKELAEAG